MSAAGLIFAGTDKFNVPELTTDRVVSGIPFGGRYRLIDFALSGMVNAGISHVGIITGSNYQSIMDHIGNGKDWDLARRTGGLYFLPPFKTTKLNQGYEQQAQTHLSLLIDNMPYIEKCAKDVLVVADGYSVCNMDIKKVLAFHEESGSDITIVTRNMNAPDNAYISVTTDENSRVTGLKNCFNEKGECRVNTGVAIYNIPVLIQLLNTAISYRMTDLHRELLAPRLDKLKISAMNFDGWFARFSTLEEYFVSSMQLLLPEVQKEVIANPERPILTKVRNSPPVYYAPDAHCADSLVADGCVIDGEVENCILFRGVHIGHGSKLKNCIIMQDTYIGENANLCCVVTDKDVLIGNGTRLCGTSVLPFFVGKGKRV